MNTDARLLVIDDEPGILGLVTRFAQRFGFEVAARSNASAGLAEVPIFKPDCVLVDLRLPDVNGLEVLRRLHDLDARCQVILMTGHSSVDTAVEAMRLGALDYLTKPFDLDRLGGVLTGVRKRIERRERLLQLDAECAKQFEFCGMIGRGPVMQDLFDSIRRLAPHVRTVLVTGETGTGKELVARALHQMGTRRDRRFVTINCSAVVETLFESELFGHQRGAFTGATDTKVGLFEHADKGTLFLDEVGELPLAIQAKLLRAVELGEVQRVGSLESRRVDTCVLAATNRDLAASSVDGRFRSDLYYRLSILEIHVAPLRERREDIPYLAATFIREISERLKRPLTGISSSAERLLHQAPWPGNVRQLRNTIERACLRCEGRILTERDVLTALSGGESGLRTAVAPPLERPSAPVPFRAPGLDRAEVQQALQQAGGNRSAAARLLGVSRRALYRRLDTLGLR